MDTIKINNPMGLPKMKIEYTRIKSDYICILSGTLYVQPCKGVWNRYQFVYNKGTDLIPTLIGRPYEKGTVDLLRNILNHYEKLTREAERRALNE